MPPDSGVSGTGRIGDPQVSAPGRSDDWASFVTAKIETLVSAIRDKAVNPVAKVVHFAIFGIVALAVGAILAVLFTVALIRIFDSEVFRHQVWASYFLVAGIFAVVGLLCVWLRKPRG